jgi:hypothetical protein
MRRCVAPARLMIPLLPATGHVSGAVFQGGAGRVAATHQGDGGSEGPLCDRCGDLRSACQVSRASTWA